MVLKINVTDADGAESSQLIGKGTYSRQQIIRPANTTAYTAGDIIGSSISVSSAIDFGEVGQLNGCVFLRSAMLLIESSALISGEAGYSLELYNLTPPSAIVDNAAFAFASGDWPSWLGTVSFGTPAVKGSALVAQVDAINKCVGIGGTNTHIFGYLITAGSYTPTSARKYDVALGFEAL